MVKKERSKKMNGERNLIQGNVPKELKDRFDAHVQAKKYQVGRIVEIMAEVWLDLPPDVQALLYAEERPGPKLLQFVQGVVNQMIGEGYQAGQGLKPPQKPKPK
jgi:hypothetical protein